MATMKQVAQRAGVSISTVSHVINNTRVVSGDVRERVQGVIDELRYIPSAVARSLKNDKTNTIGVLVPNSSNPYFAELIRWIEEAAFQRGYNMILCNAHGGARKQAAYLRLLMEKRIDGLVLVASGADDEQDLMLRDEAVPIVQLERALPGLDADLVLAGQEEGAYQATRHLIDTGHRAIACVSGPADLPRARDGGGRPAGAAGTHRARRIHQCRRPRRLRAPAGPAASAECRVRDQRPDGARRPVRGRACRRLHPG